MDTNYKKRYIPACPITYILLFTFLNLNQGHHESFGINIYYIPWIKFIIQVLLIKLSSASSELKALCNYICVDYCPFYHYCCPMDLDLLS